MSANPKKYRCNGCQQMKLKVELEFKHGQVFITISDELDTAERKVVVTLSLRAWRHLCRKCIGIELSQNKIHVEMGKGEIIELSNHNKWKEFTDKYFEIRDHFGFGCGKDKYGQYSAFKDMKKTNEWLINGKYKNLNVLNFFTLKKRKNNTSHTESNNILHEVKEEYDRTGSNFTGGEFEAVLDFFIEQKFKQIMKKTDWIKEKAMPEHMKKLLFPYRPPSAYDGLFGRIAKKERTSTHKLLKDKRIREKYTIYCEQVKDAQTTKYHLGTTKEVSINAAKDGLFSKDHREKGKRKDNKKGQNGKSIISQKLNEHKEEFQDKNYFANERLKNQKQQTEILKSIGHGLSVFGLQSDDYFGDLIVYVNMKFTPATQRKSVINIISKNKLMFSSCWGTVVRQGDIKWTDEKKNQLIVNTISSLGE
eukprot:264527_1